MRWFYLLLLVLLAGCGASGPQSSTGSPASGIQPTSAPSASAPPAASGTIPEGLTPEGYHMLGRSDAPVTITFYSDFF